jgi:SPP1 family predicted phage head-tail adaptor
MAERSIQDPAGWSARDLPYRVTLQSPSRTRNPLGEEVVSFMDVATVWAGVRALAGRELEVAREATPEISVEVLIRWRADVASDWRVKHGDRLLNVSVVLRGGPRSAFVRLNCAEGKPDGVVG